MEGGEGVDRSHSVDRMVARLGLWRSCLYQWNVVNSFPHRFIEQDPS